MESSDKAIVETADESQSHPDLKSFQTFLDADDSIETEPELHIVENIDDPVFKVAVEYTANAQFEETAPFSDDAADVSTAVESIIKSPNEVVTSCLSGAELAMAESKIEDDAEILKTTDLNQESDQSHNAYVLTQLEEAADHVSVDRLQVQFRTAQETVSYLPEVNSEELENIESFDKLETIVLKGKY
jgi:hypothetical protein